MRKISGSIVKTLYKYGAGDKKIKEYGRKIFVHKAATNRTFTSLSNKQINQIKKLYPKEEIAT